MLVGGVKQHNGSPESQFRFHPFRVASDIHHGKTSRLKPIAIRKGTRASSPRTDRDRLARDSRLLQEESANKRFLDELTAKGRIITCYSQNI
jgi:hypothetical protein